MKANELRIGNLITSAGINGIVTWEILRIIEDNPIFHNYKLIRLTEDFLKKNGFAFDGLYFSNEKYGVDTRNVDMMFFKKGKFGNDCPNIIYLCSINYVHELQNIYYVLEGIELNVV